MLIDGLYNHGDRVLLGQRLNRRDRRQKNLVNEHNYTIGGRDVLVLEITILIIAIADFKASIVASSICHIMDPPCQYIGAWCDISDQSDGESSAIGKLAQGRIRQHRVKEHGQCGKILKGNGLVDHMVSKHVLPASIRFINQCHVGGRNSIVGWNKDSVVSSRVQCLDQSVVLAKILGDLGNGRSIGVIRRSQDFHDGLVTSHGPGGFAWLNHG